MFRTIVVTASLLILCAFVGALLMAVVQLAFADGEPSIPRGFVRLQLCSGASGAPDGVAEWALIVASSVTTIGNPKGSPDGCVRVSNLNNRRIYVVGTEYEVANKVSKALAALPCGDAQ